ncbi:MAG TPA: hypothetical protein VGJ39_03445 [Vicinamibacterales bacterium]
MRAPVGIVGIVATARTSASRPVVFLALSLTTLIIPGIGLRLPLT